MRCKFDAGECRFGDIALAGGDSRVTSGAGDDLGHFLDPGFVIG